MRYFFLILIAVLTCTLTAKSQSIFDDANLITNHGFFNSFYSEKADKIYLEVTDPEASFIYVSALSEGIGSNDLGLDRGQLGATRIVKFKKAGNKLLLVQPNQTYRTITANEMEKKSVEEAFAKSVLFGFPIVETTERGYVIELTPFLMQDAHGVAAILKKKKQGLYKIDVSKSALNMERTRSFPENVDFDVLITLVGKPEGREISSVTPDAKYISVYQHHSFVKLPDDNFSPRKYYPNCGAIATTFMNYAAPIDEPMDVAYCNRHRLEKKDPKAPFSEAKQPIIYYLDNGTPEPVRSALLEGAIWWNEAFEAIGYKDAFQVRMLPDTIDPLDVRYNVIQWVHRSTRGWSYGGGVVDPRTGEIIKGHVSLGSLRVRQDYKIAKALSNEPFGNGQDATETLQEFALARIRQLSAHEVGHTLGFAHNFAASTNNRASVMDYPHPLVTLDKDMIDLTNAYANGIGEWDKITVAYSYSDFEKEEAAQLKSIIDNAMDSGFRFASDTDARPLGGAHAYGHLWDNGTNALDELQNVLQVRQKAIEQFGLNNIEDTETLDQLEDLFVLIYFYHRYQTEAAVKLIAGLEIADSQKGKSGGPTIPVSADQQRRALQLVLKTIDPNTLQIPKEKLQMFPSRGPFVRGRESFSTRTGPLFDPLAAVTTATSHTLDGLLHPERINRLLIQGTVDAKQLDLSFTLDELIASTLLQSTDDEYESELQNTINEVVTNRLMRLAQSSEVYFQVKAIVNGKLKDYLNRILDTKQKTIYQKEEVRILQHYFKNPEHIPTLNVPSIPDGSPIGSNANYNCCN
jgi:hypothetical protein